MKRFVEGEDRNQAVLLPEYLEDYLSGDNPVRVVDAFVDELDLRGLGFDGTTPAATGRPSYHPSVLLKIYIYGYLNRIQSSRRLERETQRNIELVWLTGRLSQNFKTIADFRRNNGKAIRNVCSEFIVLCRNQHLGSIQFLAQYRLPMIIHTVNLKDVLCQVNPNGSNLHGRRSFHLWGEATPNLAL
jgi:transposase